MTSYATPQAEPVSTHVDPTPSRSTTPHSVQPTQDSASGATTVAVAHVPPSAVLSNAHHHPPLQPNRHHPLPDNSWHDHHTRLKGNHIPPPRPLPPPPHHPSHHVKVEKSLSPHSQSPHHSHPTGRSHERSSHSRPPVPQTTHSYHTVNVVSPHPTGSRISTPAHHASYLYPVHQLVTPVAHVPIGAAHYAHLPPSIWSPPHAQYHQHTHAQPHQLPPQSHHVTPAVVSAPHGQVQYATSHVHHVATPAHPSAHAYAIPPPYTTTAPQHPPPHGPPHAVHPSQHHPQHHITYAYAQIPAPPPPHHPVKGTVAVSHSQPLTVGGPVSYAMPASHSPQPMGPPMTAKVSGKSEPLPAHVSHPDHVHSPNLNGMVTSGAAVKPYAVRDVISEPHRNAHGTETRTDTSPSRLMKDPALNRDRTQSFPKAPEQRKDASQKEKAQASDQPIRKPRKPYTMKKSREVWTPEEHSRFLQALQLYDRDWKKIETYIGTKTVLQIRSHAQKYFGKVTKYKTGEYIPPPRPKKRAALPYPRSRTSGQSKSSSGNGSASDKQAPEENGTHGGKDQMDLSAAKPRISAGQHPSDGKQGSPTLSGTPNGTARVDSSDKPSHVNAVDINERRYTEKYSSTSYDRQNTTREEFANNVNHGQAGSIPRWNTGPPPEGSRREQRVQVANLACANSADAKPVVNGYRSERYTHPPQNSLYKEDLGQRERQYDREYHQGTRQPVIGSENTFTPQSDRPPPNQTCSTQAVEHDSTNERPMRKKMAMPNNSLLVLSNCVDMMSRDAVPEPQPAAGWATAAAARRAHRAKVIRARKPPLPQGSIVTQEEDDGSSGKESPRRDSLSPNIVEGQRHMESREEEVKNSPSPTGGQSPQVASPAEYGSAQPPPDPQRSSAGSGTGSDDAIAGFSSSDRPSVSGSAAGSGTGGSLGTSEAGDPEEDPKSSNDGSGDDGRRSPPTRDSSPADPNSSGSRETSPADPNPSDSRETSPNEFPLPQSRNEIESGQPSPASRKTPVENGMPIERFDRPSHGEKNGVEQKANRSEVNLNRKAHENGGFPGRLLNEEKLESSGDDHKSSGDDHKSHTMVALIHTSVGDKQVSPLDRLPRLNQVADGHARTIHESSPNSRKRLRVTAEYDVDSRTDGRIGERDRDTDTKRPRVMHPVKETKYTAKPAYHRQEFTERNR